MRTYTLLAVFAVASIGLLAGCGSDTKVETVSSAAGVATAAQASTTTPSEQSTTLASTPPTVETNKAPQAYMDSLSSYSDPDKMREAIPLTASGSPAHAYISHQANLAEAALDGGQPFSDDTVDDLGDGSFKSCSDPTDEETCSTYADFKVNTSKQLVDLTVDGQTLAPRLAVGNGQTVKSGGNTFTFLTAYKAIAGSLFVTVKVETSAKPIDINLYSATYRSPNGKQREASDAVGPIELDAHSNAVVAVVFPGVATGGQVTLDGYIGDSSTQFKAAIKVG